MGTATLLREQLKQAHQFLEGTMEGVTEEQAHWAPPGTANPLGPTYAHTLISEDFIMQGMVRGSAPLMMGEWGAKMGLSEPPPPPDKGSWDEWARKVKIDLAALHAYGQAVYGATDEYLASLDDAGVERELDLSNLNFGKQTVGWFTGNLLLTHATSHWGEIACLKGLQGAKGYPF